jgi:Pyruvate/2-oxoacid:ferredoxin oxidoreductase delta subunit
VDGELRSAWDHVIGDGETPFGPFDVAARTRAGELEPAALEAARRCLRCGPCADCATCSPYCPEVHLAEPGGTLVRAPRGLPAEQTGSAVYIRAHVDAQLCRACGLCEEHCPYSAPRIGARANGRLLATVDDLSCRGCLKEGSEVLAIVMFSTVDDLSCRGCGVCVGLCPTGAMSMGHFDNPHLAEAVDRLLLPSEADL